MKEAMEQVKAEMGSDAVILHTKKYKEGGILGYGSQEMVEVTAALEEEPASAKKQPKPVAEPVAYPANPVVPSSVLSQYKTSGTAEGVAMASKLGGSPVSKLDVPEFPTFPMPSAEPVPSSRVIKGAQIADAGNAQTKPDRNIPEEEREAEAEEDRPTPPKGRRRRKSAEEESSPQEQEKIRKLEDELAQMKALLAQVMSKDQPENVVSLQEALRSQEVEEPILKDLAARSGAGETLADYLSAEAKTTLVDYLGQVIKCSEGIQLNRHGVRIVALIGATGVGKTTTLAKIAARFVLEQGISAALITADTYRISAVEQLKTYSDIIGLPLEIVYTPSELSKAIRKHRGKDLILIDTAGRSQHNEYQMKELQEFLDVNSHIEKHLVMSATTKQRDAVEIMEKFSACDPDRVIFTKTDETSSVGLILNLLHEKKIALSYLTNGQSVPDDIVPASTDKLAELLLRE